MYQRSIARIFLYLYCKVFMFSTQPGEFPGVVPNALVYSCSLVWLDRGTKPCTG